MPPFPPLKPITHYTPTALAAHLGSKNTPLLLRGLVEHWPAMREWSIPPPTPDGQQDAAALAGLRAAVGEDTGMDVEVGPRGKGYLDPAWQRITMGFGLFLDAFVLNRIPSADPTALPLGYLAQADLLDPHTHPRVAAAAPPLPHYAALNGDVYRRTLWVGPGGSFTPFHRDPNVGLYTQVSGKKVFHLAPPEAGCEDVLRVSESKLHGNTSVAPSYVRVLLAEEGEWKGRLEKAGSMDGACAAELEAGDSVLIPAGWWHTAEGVGGPGVGVNAWFR